MNDAFGRPQTVLVVGAGSDIARATLSRLAPTLRLAAMAGRRPGLLSAEPVVGLSAELRWFEFDAVAPAGHASMVGDVTTWMGDIDLAVVAHGDLGAPFDLDVDPAEVARLIDLNHAGAASVCQAIARAMANQGHGTMVVLSSVASVRPRLANLAYASAKAGLDAFAVGLDQAMAGSGARVMVVRPGFVHTKMTKGRSVQPLAAEADDVATAIVEGLARRKRVVWVPSVLKVSPLFRIVPRTVWWRISNR